MQVLKSELREIVLEVLKDHLDESDFESDVDEITDDIVSKAVRRLPIVDDDGADDDEV